MKTNIQLLQIEFCFTNILPNEMAVCNDIFNFFAKLQRTNKNYPCLEIIRTYISRLKIIH